MRSGDDEELLVPAKPHRRDDDARVARTAAGAAARLLVLGDGLIPMLYALDDLLFEDSLRHRVKSEVTVDLVDAVLLYPKALAVAADTVIGGGLSGDVPSDDDLSAVVYEKDAVILNRPSCMKIT